MTEFDLWATEKPRLGVLSNGDSVPILKALPPTGAVFIARLDGSKMVDSYGVFEEFSKTLKFPAYFGWNWPALSDCIRDLDWIPADRYLLLIENPSLLLRSEAEERDVLFRILAQAGNDWANLIGKNCDARVSFNVCFVCDGNEIESIRREISTFE
jgi:hypothetical protein